MSCYQTRTGDAPLLAWGDALREHRRRRISRRRYLLVVTAGLALVLAPVVFVPAPRLVWNASASAPAGLYAVTPGAIPRRGDRVIARMPATVRPLAARRGYLPEAVPLVKRVAAVSGEQVCAQGRHIYVNGRAPVVRLRRDSAGRLLHWWHGCRNLAKGQVFLLGDADTSFDGRYFGVTEGRDIIGRARLLWRR